MLGIRLDLTGYLDECCRVIHDLHLTDIQALSDDLLTTWQTGRFVFVCGNGGAGSTAGHFAEDLLKSTLDPKDYLNNQAKRLKVMSLSENTSAILAWANDEGFERVFVEQLKNFASPGDILIAMSGSGNSKNVLNAVEWANQHQLTTWGLTGYDGGELQTLASRNLHIPVTDMGITQSMHLMVFHWILDDLHSRINLKGRYSTVSAKLEPKLESNQNSNVVQGVE
jgi:D-sedoheptulose 7-phosphate isomerase